MLSSPYIHVVAAAVMDAQQRVLIAQRPAGKHLAGGWEFPGGKLEPGEQRIAGLARELREELGVEIGKAPPRPLIRISHTYPGREVLLDMWVVNTFSGVPRGLDGQALRWCTQDELEATELLPADAPIVAALRLPERLTEGASPWYGFESSASGRLRGAFCANADEATAAVAAGADFLALSRKLPAEQLVRLCEAIPLPVFARELALQEAWQLGASGTNELAAG